MMKGIPRHRLLLYAAVLSLLPALLVSMYFYSLNNTVAELTAQAESILDKVVQKQTKQAMNVAVIEHFRNADNFYLDKHLEGLRFLRDEREALQAILENKQFIEDKALRRRYEFLSGEENALTFNEGAVVRYPLFKEVIESQTRPVEVDLNDLTAILRLVEGVPWRGEAPPPGRPQLIVLDFKLDKKVAPEDYHLFSLNMRLLKREYL